MSADEHTDYTLLQVVPSGSAEYSTVLDHLIHPMDGQQGMQQGDKADNAHIIPDADVMLYSKQLKDSDKKNVEP